MGSQKYTFGITKTNSNHFEKPNYYLLSNHYIKFVTLSYEAYTNPTCLFRPYSASLNRNLPRMIRPVHAAH